MTDRPIRKPSKQRVTSYVVARIAEVSQKGRREFELGWELEKDCDVATNLEKRVLTDNLDMWSRGFDGSGVNKDELFKAKKVGEAIQLVHKSIFNSKMPDDELKITFGVATS